MSTVRKTIHNSYTTTYPVCVVDGSSYPSGKGTLQVTVARGGRGGFRSRFVCNERLRVVCSIWLLCLPLWQNRTRPSFVSVSEECPPGCTPNVRDHPVHPEKSVGRRQRRKNTVLVKLNENLLKERGQLPSVLPWQLVYKKGLKDRCPLRGPGSTQSLRTLSLGFSLSMFLS